MAVTPNRKIGRPGVAVVCLDHGLRFVTALGGTGFRGLLACRVVARRVYVSL